MVLKCDFYPVCFNLLTAVVALARAERQDVIFVRVNKKKKSLKASACNASKQILEDIVCYNIILTSLGKVFIYLFFALGLFFSRK